MRVGTGSVLLMDGSGLDCFREQFWKPSLDCLLAIANLNRLSMTIHNLMVVVVGLRQTLPSVSGFRALSSKGVGSPAVTAILLHNQVSKVDLRY